MASVLGKAMHMIITLVFLVMAYFNYLQPSPLCSVDGPFGFLSSMWLMYLLMATAHGSVCLALLKKGESCDCSASEASGTSAAPSMPAK